MPVHTSLEEIDKPLVTDMWWKDYLHYDLQQLRDLIANFTPGQLFEHEAGRADTMPSKPEAIHIMLFGNPQVVVMNIVTILL